MDALGAVKQPPAAKVEQFSTTHWTVVLRAGSGDSRSAQEAMEKLCHRYWLPLYAFARRLGHVEEVAKDLTQGFFAQFLGNNSVQAADPGRGRFRTFLLTSFQRFITNEWEKGRTAKRGKGFTFVSIDDLQAIEEFQHKLGAECTPDKVYDRQWAVQIFSHALRRLHDEYQRAHKSLEFDNLKEFLSQPGDNEVYAERARTLELRPETVAVAVHRLRKRYRDLLRAEIANTVCCPEDLDAEFCYLLEVMGE